MDTPTCKERNYAIIPTKPFNNQGSMEDVQGLGDPFSTEAGNYCKRKQLSWEIPENIILKLGQWLGAHDFQFFEKTSDNFTLHCTAWSIRLLIETTLSTERKS